MTQTQKRYVIEAVDVLPLDSGIRRAKIARDINPDADWRKLGSASLKPIAEQIAEGERERWGRLRRIRVRDTRTNISIVTGR